MAAMSNYLENKLIDALFRGQSYTFPTTVYIGLLASDPTDVNGGTEVSAASYLRCSVACSLLNWSGTQGTGTTVASTGTTATTSNNQALTFATPAQNWGAVTHVGVYDAPTGGNLLFYGALGNSKTINTNDVVTFPINALAFQLDD